MPDGFEKFTRPPSFIDIKKHHISWKFILPVTLAIFVMLTTILHRAIPEITSAYTNNEILLTALLLATFLMYYIFLIAFFTTMLIWKIFNEEPPN